ncbi:MAG: SIS domain-containing protein [Flavobacteriaceae bacterium]|nr:SIS domain-containing protein [Flavobacteriaceae bacterium]
MSTKEILEKLIERYPALGVCKKEILEAGELIIESYKNSGQLLTCGNGGSCSDSDHIVGEMMKSFSKKRPLDNKHKEALKAVDLERGAILAMKMEKGLPAISLNAHAALVSAISNDIGGDFIFAQQVNGYGRVGDVLLGISSSGNSQNVVDACITAKAKGLKVIALVGETGGKMKQFADVAICVPSTCTPDIQEFHLPIYHALCIMAEETFF